MAGYSGLTRLGVRRLVALHPDAERRPLHEMLREPEILGSLPWERAARQLKAYLFDPAARSIGDGDPDVEAWIDDSLILRRLAPWNGAPISDDVAAVLVGPELAAEGRLGGPANRWRFAVRADDAIGAALASLAPDAASREIVRLAAEPGPDEGILHLALLQAGRALAWCGAEVLALGDTSAVVEGLLKLLVKESPEPLLAAVVRALGPIAATSTPAGALVRSRTLAALEGAAAGFERPKQSQSFLDELQQLDRKRKFADEDYYRSLPYRQVAGAAAEILGRAAPRDRAVFGELRAAVVDRREDRSELLAPFLDGLVAAAAVEQLKELVGQLLERGDELEQLLALGVANELPLDGCASVLVGMLETPTDELRLAAVGAVSLLAPELAVPALERRLEDTSADVCALAAQALVDLGERERVASYSSVSLIAPGIARARIAAVRAAVSEADPAVVAELVKVVAERAASDEESAVESPLVDALGLQLRTTAEGLRRAAELIMEIPESLPIVTVALTTTDRDGYLPAIGISPALRAELDGILMPIVERGGGEGVLALVILCRLSVGDERLVRHVAQLVDDPEVGASELLTALADLRVRSEEAAAILAPFLEDEEHIGAQITAASVAGMALPASHELWGRVRSLLEMGTVASAAAWAALVNGARVASSNRQL